MPLLAKASVKVIIAITNWTASAKLRWMYKNSKIDKISTLLVLLLLLKLVKCVQKYYASYATLHNVILNINKSFLVGSRIYK